MQKIIQECGQMQTRVCTNSFDARLRKSLYDTNNSKKLLLLKYLKTPLNHLDVNIAYLLKFYVFFEHFFFDRFAGMAIERYRIHILMTPGSLRIFGQKDLLN